VPLGGQGDLRVARAAVLEGPEGDEHCTWIAAMAERGHRQRLTHGAAAVRARPVDARHQLRSVPVRVQAEDLEDRRRAANLPADVVAVRNAVRRPKARDCSARRLRQL
jgi:hypothetical protein